MSIRLETTNTESAKRMLELSKFSPKESMSCAVRGVGNRPPTIKAVMQKRESSHE